MLIDLKPCPFCGSSDLELCELGGNDSYYVECQSCGCQHHANREEEYAVKRWNTRHVVMVPDQPVECDAAFNVYWNGLEEICVHPDYASDIWQAAWVAAQRSNKREIVSECKAGIPVVKPEYAARGWVESTTDIEDREGI